MLQFHAHVKWAPNCPPPKAPAFMRVALEDFMLYGGPHEYEITNGETRSGLGGGRQHGEGGSGVRSVDVFTD